MSTPAEVIRERTPIGEVAADPARQYVLSGSMYGSELLARTISDALADIDRGLAARDYDQMLSDSEIAKNMKVIKTSVLSEALELAPAVAEDDPRFPRAKEVYEFHVRSLSHMVRSSRQSTRDIFWMMLDHLPYGNKAAEVTMARPNESGRDRMKMYLDSINVLPRKSVGYVMTPYNRCIGLVGRTEDRPWSSHENAVTNPGAVIPRDKFWVMTNQPKDGLPTGVSMLDPCWILWKMKCDLYPEWMRWLAFVALPFLVGTAAQGLTQQKKKDREGRDVLNPDGSPVYLTQEEALAQVLGGAIYNRAIAVPHGAKVDSISMSSDGEPFSGTFGFLDASITAVMLLQQLTTRTTDHAPRALGTVHEAVQDLLVFFTKGALCDDFRRDVLGLSTFVNFGPQDVDLAPKCSLGDTERRSWAKEGSTLAQLVAVDYFVDEQYREMDIQFGVQPRPLNYNRSEHLASLRPAQPEGQPGADPAAQPGEGQEGRRPAGMEALAGMSEEGARLYAVRKLGAQTGEAERFVAGFRMMREFLLKGEAE